MLHELFITHCISTPGISISVESHLDVSAMMFCLNMMFQVSTVVVGITTQPACRQSSLFSDLLIHIYTPSGHP